MRAADYIMQFLAELGIKHVFYVSGGASMYLNDALGRSRLDGICMLHEQGAAIAAEASARISRNYGACLTTGGPGGTNAVTGLVGAYMDSSPVIFISGQVKCADLRENALPNGGELRQFGIQEVDIIPIVAPYAKYAVRIDSIEKIRYELEKAAKIAMQGRPGPVWLDIPLDIQAAGIEPEKMAGYEENYSKPAAQEADIEKTLHLLEQAQRPLLMLGNGIRLAHAEQEAGELVKLLGIPVQTSWNGLDLIAADNPLCFGRPGIVANRAENIILQQADFVLSIGARMGLLTTGFNYESFLGKAVHVMVDIDPTELVKKNVHPQLPICSDAGDFIRQLLQRKEKLSRNSCKEWLEQCRSLTEKYPKFIPAQEPGRGYVSNYHLIDEISRQMTGEDIYQFTSSGTTVDIAMKIFRVKQGQRAFLTKGLAAMGYDIPACIGSCIASGGRRTVCLTGDGSSAMNMQELEVIHRLNLPIKLFISDNRGYAMIYGSQNGNFKGHLTGCTRESGLTLPDMGKIAEAFGIKVMRIRTEENLPGQVSEVLAYEGPVVCIVRTDITQPILPKQANYMREDGQMASRPLDDMAPLLPRDEYEEMKKMY